VSTPTQVPRPDLINVTMGRFHPILSYPTVSYTIPFLFFFSFLYALLSSNVKPAPLVTQPRQVPSKVWLGQAARAALAHSSHVPLKKLSVAPPGAVSVHLAVPDVDVVDNSPPAQLVMGA
jgi:hypothetical protein